MRRLVHLSDLHFGRERPDLIGPLLAAIEVLAPDLVAISGDLTQRARPSQFRAARAFLDSVPAPLLVVPGNHDVPLHLPARRLLAPWRGWRRWIGEELEPTFEDAAMTVVGVNSVDPLSWQTGRLSRRRLARACDRLGLASAAEAGPRVRVVVVHHPLVHPEGSDKTPIPDAAAALRRLTGCGADLILSGHLHAWHAAAFAEQEDDGSAIQLHAGTGLSTRVRGEPNDFNLVELSPDRIAVTRHVAGTGAYAPAETRTFAPRGEGWTAVPSAGG